MSRRLILILAAVAVLLFVGAYVGSPYPAVRSFVAAAKSGNVQRLNEAVDFPAVRKGLKSQVADAIGGRTRRGPFGGLGKLLAPLIADQTVDALVTPESIAQLVKHGEVKGAPTPGKAPKRPLSYSYSYAGLDRFRMTLVSPDHPASPGTLIFERRNLFWWKLVRVELPKHVLTGRKSEPVV